MKCLKLHKDIKFLLARVSSTNLKYLREHWCVFVRAALHMRREEKRTRFPWMVYCTYNMLNIFRKLLCPSSGARDYMCVTTAHGVRCLVAGCRGSGAGQQAMRPGRGMLHDGVVMCLSVHRCICVEKKNEPDPPEWFIVLIICSTYFGHFYAHHQELETICVLLPPMVCGAWLLVVGGQVRGSRLCV